MAGKTEINEALLVRPTEINPSFGDAVSGALFDGSNMLGGKYRLLNKLDVTTGEAELFVCAHNGIEYIAKIYRRGISIKSDVIDKLKGIDSPYISKIIDTGMVNGKVYEILHYYKKGSLQGKTFDLEKLKKFIIPCIAEGLKILHSHGIIHKDLKPHNIMICDDGKSVAIIDFGISSVKSGGSTVVITNTGMTPEYSAPEAFKGLFLAESDYYSFGITLYELFCGSTPYKDMPDDEIEKYVSVQKLPKPPAMPEELYELICALTYYDITNRRDKENPNRRWTYDEVVNWLRGVKQQIPGTGGKPVIQMPAYGFMGKKYSDIPSLAVALAENWDEGKRQLERGLLSGYFKSFDPEIAGRCIDAENEIIERKEILDVIFFRLLYSLHSELRELYFAGKHFRDLREFGNFMLEKLAVNDTSDYNYYKSVLLNGILSEYAGFINGGDKLKSNLINLESTFRRSVGRGTEVVFYVTAHFLSGKRTLDIEGRIFESVEELAEYIKSLAASHEKLEEFCSFLIDDEFRLNSEFEGWLFVHGKKDEINAWRSGV